MSGHERIENAERSSLKDKPQSNDNLDALQLMSERTQFSGKTESIGSSLPALELVGDQRGAKATDNKATDDNKTKDNTADNLIAQQGKDSSTPQAELKQLSDSLDARFSTASIPEAKQASKNYNEMMAQKTGSVESVKTFDESTQSSYNSRLEETTQRKDGVKLHFSALKHGAGDEWHPNSVELAGKLQNGVEVYAKGDVPHNNTTLWIHLPGSREVQKMENVKVSDLEKTLGELKKIQLSSDVQKS